MFHLEKTTAQGRKGLLQTIHGQVKTPAFMPIATKGSVKALTPEDLRELGAQMILSNTFHLWLQPGLEVLKAAGGLHRFMQWPGPILTDSGGYQVFSLSRFRKIIDEGVHFQSPRDGSKHFLTPERSIEIQGVIGSDITMVLDDVQPPDAPKKRIAEAVHRTTSWAKRCFDAPRKSGQQLFGIVQGGVFEDLRKESAHSLIQIPFDGFAVGGLAVGETEHEMLRMTEVVTTVLPVEKPRYFMGGAKPDQIVALVSRGIDLFDCVIPTREARHGRLYVWQHEDLAKPDFYTTINIKNAAFDKDQQPVDASCDCETCRNFSRSYLRHLFAAEEPLALRLATLHNVRFYLSLMDRIRKNIEHEA